ncbi:hypothetical protein CMUS01_16171 [Colletotrichum musicola]|uniref:Uncharacterized protein n=1 Tax=Colletotrichum musicola TaxID=2175873 RepID=A0A8H6IQK1_9PEZI|nr:hypothetical protein CMUS01_16171 [Colletotrichum musicola]
MKFAAAIVLGAIATIAAAQNCWEDSFSWSPTCGRGHCAYDYDINVCTCEGCEFQRYETEILCCA